MAILPAPVFLREGQTGSIFPLVIYEPGSYTVLVQPSGNSILSSLLVLGLDPGASVAVHYYQTTSADETEERSDIVSHEPLTVPAAHAHQILVTRIHSKVYVELVVTGGRARLGVMGSVVSSFATDLETALKRSGQDVVPETDKGIPVAVINTTTNEFQLWGGPNGTPAVRLLGDVQVNLDALRSPSVLNATLPSSTESALPLPSGTRAFSLKTRSGAPCRLAFTLGGTDTDFLTAGAFSQQGLDPANPLTLYAQTVRTSGDVLEVLAWK